VYSCSIPYLPFICKEQIKSWSVSQSVRGSRCRSFQLYATYTGGKGREGREICIPRLLGGDLRAAEDLGGVVPLVGGDWLAGWGVAIAHHLWVKPVHCSAP
jgi:hypothetical protein